MRPQPAPLKSEACSVEAGDPRCQPAAFLAWNSHFKGRLLSAHQPVDPQKDKRITGGFYAIVRSRVDGSVWSTIGVFGSKGAVVDASASDADRFAVVIRTTAPLEPRCAAIVRHPVFQSIN